MRHLLLALAFVALVGCDEAPQSLEPNLEGVPAEAPFATDDLSRLVLQWADTEGLHTAASLQEIPVAARGRVRLDSLELPPEARDADVVWVADLSGGTAQEVRRMDRAAFDLWVAQATGEGQADVPTAVADASVIIYGAEWCQACQSAARYLRAKDVPFVEKNIEQDPGAREEMARKARAAGLAPSGIPVIDVRGRILTGFDPGSLDRALATTAGTTI